MKAKFILFILSAFLLLLSGCGQTGPLYLPSPDDTQNQTETQS